MYKLVTNTSSLGSPIDLKAGLKEIVELVPGSALPSFFVHVGTVGLAEAVARLIVVGYVERLVTVK